MLRLFRYKHNKQSGMLHTTDKWYLARDNNVCDTCVVVAIKELEAHENYEELV